MLTSRPDKAKATLRHLIIFCLAVGLSRPVVLLAQTNNSSVVSGNRTTGGANQGASNSSGVSGSRSTGSASPASSGKLGSGTVNLNGGTVILRGTVATDHDRDLAARVVLLEATVDDVVNLLAVANPGRVKRP